MISYIKQKFEKKKLKNIFKEYGYEVNKFNTQLVGEVEYAQWLHPFESKKNISDSNIQFYKRLSCEGSLIIDIGAHTGDTTVPMALAVGSKGKVIGFEPNKYVYKILEKNSKLNKEKTNIIPFCLACTKEDGDFTFNYSDASFCNGGFLSKIKSNKHRHKYELEISGRNLQKFLLKNFKSDLSKLSLVKIDAEGYDKEIIKTIPDILYKYKPALMIECYKYLNNSERNELFDLVKQFGYKLYYLDNFEQFDKLDEIQRKNMYEKKHFEILAVHSSKSCLYNVEKGC
jgi:FkbM family methyltransferase